MEMVARRQKLVRLGFFSCGLCGPSRSERSKPDGDRLEACPTSGFSFSGDRLEAQDWLQSVDTVSRTTSKVKSPAM